MFKNGRSTKNLLELLRRYLWLFMVIFVLDAFWFFTGIRNSDYNILKAVGLYTFGGLVVTGALTPSGFKTIIIDLNCLGVPGLLKADLFHIIVIGANMLISRSIHQTNQFKLKQ